MELEGCKSLYIASYYRPKENDVDNFEEFRRSLNLASEFKGDIWVLGDLSFPKLSWNVPEIRPGCNFTHLYEEFTSLTGDCNLVQMVTQPTRGENVLDLFLTSNFTLVNKDLVLPGRHFRS